MQNDGDVVPFKRPAPKKKNDPSILRTDEIVTIGFLRASDYHDFYIEDPVDIAKVFAFIARSGIKIHYGGELEPPH